MAGNSVRSWLRLACVLALVVTVSGAAIGATATLAPTGGQVDAGATTTVDVTLSSAPEGIAGFEFRLELPNTDRVEVVNATVNDRFGIAESEVLDDGAAARFKAADIEERVQPGSENVTLASVTLSGVAPGDVTLDLALESIEDDDGDRIQPSVGTASVTVRDSGSGGQGGGSGSGDDGGQSGGDDGSETPPPTATPEPTPTPDSDDDTDETPTPASTETVTTTTDGPGTSTATPEGTGTSTAAPSDTPDSTSTAAPGFGALLALTALAVAVVGLRRRA